MHQGSLHEEVEDFFSVEKAANFKAVDYDYVEETDNDHGRLEIRRYWITEEFSSLSTVPEWKGLRSIGMVERECWQNDEETVEKRFFINSIPNNAMQFSQAVRGHWGVENPLHWLLDAVFGEDTSRIHKENGPAIMTSIRHLCLNLFEREPSSLSMAKKIRKASWNDNFLAKVLYS